MSQASQLLKNLVATGTPEENPDVLVIDNRLRTIKIPKSITNLGVQYDGGVLQLKFKMPRYLDDTDLSEFMIRVNYLNPNGESDIYTVSAPVIGNNEITFVWLVGPTATAYRGVTKFNVSLSLYDENGMVLSEYNTTPASLPVLEGLKCSEQVVYKYSDIVQQWEDRLSLSELNRIDAVVAMKADNLYFDPNTSMLYLMSNGEIIGDGVTVATGGGGGGTGGGVSNNAVLTLKNNTGWTYKGISQNSECKLLFTWSSLEDDISTGAGTVSVKVGGIVRYTSTVEQGPIEIDVSKYLSIGSNTVRVSVSDIYENTRTIAYTINVVSLTITSAFDPSTAYTGDINFSYIPTGAVEKTVRFIVDDAEIGQTVTSVSGRQQSFTIPAQPHGSHTLTVYFEADINGETVPSNVLFYDIICLENKNLTPIITSPSRLNEAEQYVAFTIPYTVYVPQSLTAEISLWANGVLVSNLTVDRTQQSWSYRPDIPGDLTLEIRCAGSNGKTTIKEFKMVVAESRIKAEAETENLALYLSSYGRSNNEADPGVWEDRDIVAEFSNFNFVSDGWKKDEDGIDVLRVSGDARLYIPYKMFATDFRTDGKTIEFELATRDVLNYSAEVISCYSDGRGYKITAQQLYLTSSLSTIGTRYKEDEHIRVAFTIDKMSENHLILCYINGIMSGVVQYPGDKDNFAQTNPVGITIGSNYCTTDLYNIRVYDNNLTRHQILDNWVADTQKALDRLDRFKRNDVYDEYGRVVISKLPPDLCYMVIQAPKLPQFKGDKKSCDGYFVDPQDSSRNFSWTNAQIDVQGTSSQYYYRKNYKVKYSNGITLSNDTLAGTYQMNRDAVPTNTFTMKADVASSEGAFNVVLSMLYNELSPYKTPAQNEDHRVRQTIEGFPMVIFWDNGTETTFLGKYNFNNDKGTPEVFGFKSGDESWEILQNGTDRVGWHSADFSGDGWKADFEARYPDKNTNITRLRALAEWLVSTDVDKATGDAITPVTYNDVTYNNDTEEYRLAKFSAELSDYFIEEAIIFYYLFTEIFLSIDQREKNAFPTYLKDENRWIVLFYDADSSCGTDNKGNLTFDYYLEDIDYTEGGEPIYNGQRSVLWKNLKATRYNEIMTMYQNFRTDDLISYEHVIGKFEDHQSKWSEAIFNEDMYHKCLEPLFEANDKEYLPMLQGKKEQWMKWWLYNRFRYLDSKYITGTSKTNYIKIRSRAKANVHLTAYVNMYGHVMYNSDMVEHRMERDREYEFVWDASGAEDAVIGIYDGDMITSLGDLAPLIAEEVNVSVATHLTDLKVGDASDDYRNHSLKTLSLGNNILLRTLDVRNCPNLTQHVDISGCTNIEEVYFDGTSIAGLDLPNGGILKILHLPETVKDLTLRNQTALTEFVIPSYANIETLRIENSFDTVDPFEILDSLKPKCRVRIIGFDKTVNSVDEIFAFYDKLDTMLGIDESGKNTDKPQMSGTIRIDSILGSELGQLQSRYPSITIAYKTLTSSLYFYNDDGTKLLYTNKVTNGGNGMYVGNEPTKASTDKYRYEFIGWSKTIGGDVDDDAIAAVTIDRSVYAVFVEIIRTFTVRFYNMGTLIQTIENVPYGTDAVYTGSTPERGVDDYVFMGFSPSGENIVGDTDCHAMYRFTGLVSRNIIERDISEGYSNDRVRTIGNYSLYGCRQLTFVDFPAATSVGTYAFGYCDKITSIDLPNVASVDAYAFYNCTGLRGVNLPSVTSLGTNAFTGCSLLASLSLPSITTIDAYAFRNNTNLKTIELQKVTSIGNYAFSYSGIRTIVAPSLVTVGDYAFSDCESLQTVDLPSLVTVGDYAFVDCRSLKTVDLPSVTKLGSRAFDYCNSLQSIVLPKLTEAKSSAFGNNSLKTIVLPLLASVVTSMFWGLRSLRTVDLPSAVEIGGSAFNYCYSLTTLILRSETVVTLSNTSAFDNCCHILGTTDSTYNPNGDKDGYIYVPAVLVESYKIATNWSAYADQIRAIEDYPEICGGEV